MSRSKLIVLAATIVLAGFYISGRLDRPLSSVGLNLHECARNGLGTTFCGQELIEYRTHMRRVQTRIDAAKARVAELETQARANREQQAYENSPEGRESAEQIAAGQACHCDPAARR